MHINKGSLSKNALTHYMPLTSWAFINIINLLCDINKRDSRVNNGNIPALHRIRTRTCPALTQFYPHPPRTHTLLKWARPAPQI